MMDYKYQVFTGVSKCVWFKYVYIPDEKIVGKNRFLMDFKRNLMGFERNLDSSGSNFK